MHLINDARCAAAEFNVAAWDAEAVAALREIAAAALDVKRDGDVLRFGAERASVEIVIGFRPGVDRIVVDGTQRVLATDEAGRAVILDAARRRIVLEGVTLAELCAGDIAIG
jgi:hypothetical protein